MLVTTPLAVSIKRAIPEAVVDYLVFEGTEGVLEHNPLIRKVITVRRDKSNKAMLAAMFRSYDVALAAYPSDRTAAAAAIAGKCSFGLSYNRKNDWWKHMLFDGWQRCDDRNHVINNILSLLTHLEIPAVPRVMMGYDQCSQDKAHMSMPHDDYIILHPYTRSSYKCCPAVMWGELAGLILEHTDCRVVFTRTPTAEDDRYLEKILSMAPATTDAMSAPCSLCQLATTIKGSRAYVGVDTVVTHIAAALDIPMIALFGPTLTRYWGPWPNGYKDLTTPYAHNNGVQVNGYITVLQKEWECVPCNLESCAISTCGKMECLEAITAKEVFVQLMYAISSTPEQE